jgi:hypothetical protein
LKITRRQIRRYLKKYLLNERTGLGPAVGKALTIRRTGTAAQQISYLHDLTFEKESNNSIKNLSSLLKQNQFPVSSVQNAKKANYVYNGPTPLSNKKKAFLFSKDNPSLEKNNFSVIDSNDYINYSAWLLSMKSSVREFGSSGDCLEFAVSNMVAESFDSYIVKNRTDTAPGRDIEIDGSEIYFEVKYTQGKDADVEKQQILNLDNSDIVEIFYGSPPSSKPNVATGASPPTNNTNKYFIIITPLRGYLVNSAELINFLFVSSNFIPLNLDKDDPENAKILMPLKQLVNDRPVVRTKMRSFLDKNSLNQNNEQIELSKYMRKIIDFMNRDDNTDVRNLFKTFLFGSLVNLQQIGDDTSLITMKPTEIENAKIEAHIAIQTFLKGVSNVSLSERINNFNSSDNPESESYIDFRKDETKINKNSALNLVDYMGSFIRLFGIALADDPDIVSPPSMVATPDSKTIGILNRISTVITWGKGGIKSFLADEKYTVGIRLNMLINFAYIDSYNSPEKVDETRAALNSLNNRRGKRQDAPRRFTKYVIENKPLSDFNNYGSRDVLSAEMSRNKKYFDIIFSHYGYGIAVNSNELFSTFSDKIFEASPMTEDEALRPSNNLFDDLYFEIFFNSNKDLFLNSFNNSYAHDLLFESYEELNTDEENDKTDVNASSEAPDDIFNFESDSDDETSFSFSSFPEDIYESKKRKEINIIYKKVLKELLKYSK